MQSKADRSSKSRCVGMCSLLLLVASLLGNAQATSNGSIRFVQAKAPTPQTPASSVAVTYPAAETAGDLNVVVVGWNDTTSSVSSISDSRGNSYTLAVGPTSGTGLRQSIYYAKNIAGGSNTVTVTFNQAANFVDVRALEYSGASTSSPVDVTAAAVGSGSLANSGSATTTTANDLIFGAGITEGAISGAGSGFTSRVITPDGDIAEDKVGASAGSYSATAPVTPYAGSSTWVMQMVGFKANALSGTPGSAPAISSASPSSGSTNGGTAVTIIGTNFVSGSMVTFGGTAASDVTVASSTSISATTPAHAAGAVNVVVSDNNGSSTLTNGFTFTTTAAIQHKVVLSWKASSSANIMSYNVYRSTISGGYYGLIGSTAGSLSYTDDTVESGTTCYYVTTAVNNQGQQSEYSNQAVATVPSP